MMKPKNRRPGRPKGSKNKKGCKPKKVAHSPGMNGGYRAKLQEKAREWRNELKGLFLTLRTNQSIIAQFDACYQSWKRADKQVGRLWMIIKNWELYDTQNDDQMKQIRSEMIEAGVRMEAARLNINHPSSVTIKVRDEED